MVFRKNRIAVCSTFGIHVYTHAPFHSGVATNSRALGRLYAYRKKGFGMASRTHTCLLSKLRHGSVTFHETAYTQHTPYNINRDIEGISTTDVAQRLKEKKYFVTGMKYCKMTSRGDCSWVCYPVLAQV